ncbi:MAG: flagellar biosynthesis repressor FlbT [Pirellulaceae bacterium]|jgi:flagellar protein FlbT|nr:flagellar biosynthesis repressor FlbT [Pirellulaceae bacterium]
MPLKLILKPGEKVIINQAVVLNGGEKTELVLQNKASVMRERDIMTETGADSPAKNIYFAVQMMYMFPEKERHYQERFNEMVKDFIQAVPSSTPIILDVGRKVIEGNLYSAMKECKKLMKYEAEVLKHVTE